MFGVGVDVTWAEDGALDRVRPPRRSQLFTRRPAYVAGGRLGARIERRTAPAGPFHEPGEQGAAALGNRDRDFAGRGEVLGEAGMEARLGGDGLVARDPPDAGEGEAPVGVGLDAREHRAPVERAALDPHPRALDRRTFMGVDHTPGPALLTSLRRTDDVDARLGLACFAVCLRGRRLGLLLLPRDASDEEEGENAFDQRLGPRMGTRTVGSPSGSYHGETATYRRRTSASLP